VSKDSWACPGRPLPSRASTLRPRSKSFGSLVSTKTKKKHRRNHGGRREDLEADDRRNYASDPRHRVPPQLARQENLVRRGLPMPSTNATANAPSATPTSARPLLPASGTNVQSVITKTSASYAVVKAFRMHFTVFSVHDWRRTGTGVQGSSPLAL
jgi:hypothetical protein